MSQLPPKAPIHTPHHDVTHPWAPPAVAADEFVEFTAAKRGAHRRSASDSVAFIEMGQFPGLDGPNAGPKGVQFEKLDDEQLMSMFNSELGSTTSTSDHNSTNEEKRNATSDGKNAAVEREAEEVESAVVADSGKSAVAAASDKQVATASAVSNVAAVDPKRVKRILANRQSAQRSRVRKLQYISELERSVNSLQSEVAMLTPRVAYLDHQRMMLNMDNSALKAKMAALAQDKIFKDAHQEALKREIERLRQVYHHQTLKAAADNSTIHPSPSPASQPPPSNTFPHEHEPPYQLNS